MVIAKNILFQQLQKPEMLRKGNLFRRNSQSKQSAFNSIQITETPYKKAQLFNGVQLRLQDQ